MEYKTLNYISKQEAIKILKNNKTEELLLLPLSLGEYCPDWEFAQNICLKLANSENQNIKANAILGLSYVARNHLCLEEEQVKKAVYNVVRSKLDLKNFCRVIEAADDIHIYMKWKIGIRYRIIKLLFKFNCLLKNRA